MDALNQVRRCRRSDLHDVTCRVANTKRFGNISLPHFFNDDAIVFGCNFSSHSSHSCFHENRSMTTTSWLGRSFPYISMICWHGSLSSGILVITVGIKNKSLDECDNSVNLNLSSLINLSMKRIANTPL